MFAPTDIILNMADRGGDVKNVSNTFGWIWEKTAVYNSSTIDRSSPRFA